MQSCEAQRGMESMPQCRSLVEGRVTKQGNGCSCIMCIDHDGKLDGHVDDAKTMLEQHQVD